MKLSLLMATVLMHDCSFAKELGVTVIQRTFDDFATQRNFALQQSTTGFSFDLDENVTQNLLKKFK
jgi:hypothetical protein